jgi:tetratricopeptide (TPR) repeat protein
MRRAGLRRGQGSPERFDSIIVEVPKAAVLARRDGARAFGSRAANRRAATPISNVHSNNGQADMAKKLNKNLVIGLAVLGFVITTATGVVMVKFLQQADPKEFASRAEKYVEQGEWGRALQYYNRAYRSSEDPEYLVASGDMLRKLGKEMDALKTYKSAVVVAPDLLTAQEKLLDLELEMADMRPGQTDPWLQVRQTAEAILDLSGQEEHPRALYALGAAFLGLKEQSPEYEMQGVETLEKAVEAAPSAVEPAQRLASYHIQRGDRPVAETLLKKLVAANNKPGKAASEARCLLAKFYVGEGQLYEKEDAPELAEQAFERAAAVFADAEKFAGSDPEAREALYADLAEYWTTRWSNLAGEFGDESEVARTALANAESAANQAIEAKPESYEGYIYLAELRRRQGDIPGAIEVLEQRLALPFVREGFQAFQSRTERYLLLIAAADLNTTLAGQQPRGSDAMQDYAAEAQMHVTHAQGEYPKRPEASLAQGKLSFVLGEFSDAVKWFELAEQQSIKPTSMNLHFLALARERIGQTGAALEAAQRAIALPGAASAAWSTYGRLLRATDKPRGALEAADQALKLDPNNRDARVVRINALKDLNEDEALAAELEKVTTDQPGMLVGKARFLVMEGRAEEGLALVREALAKEPANVRLVAEAAGICRRLERPDEARAIVAAALAEDPENFDLKLLELQFGTLDDDARRKQYAALVESLPDAYDRAIRLAGVYAEEDDSARQRAQLGEAKRLILEGATESARAAGEPAMRAIIDRLIELSTKARDFTALDALIEEAADWKNGAGLDGAEGLSYQGRRILIDAFVATEQSFEAAKAGKTDEADRLRDQAQALYQDAVDALQLAIDKFPSNGQAYSQLGEAFLQMRRFVEARAALEKAEGLLGKNAYLVKRLAQVCKQLNDEAAYNAWLAECQEVAPEDPWVMQQTLAQQDEANPREGIARREQLRRENPDDPANLMALARLYAKIGDNAKAEECIDAVVAADNSRSIVVQAAALLREVGMADKGLAVLRNYLSAVPDDEKAVAQILVADHLAATGDPSADAAYLSAGDIDPNEKVCYAIGRHFYLTGRFQVAEEWLKRAHDLARANKSVQATSIHQMRIETAVRLDELDRAQALCDEFVAENPEDAAGIFLNAEIKSAKGMTGEAIRALSEFLETAERGTSVLSDHRRNIALFRRAQFNFNRGRLQDAIEDLEALIAADPAALGYSPRILVARAYEKSGRPDAALRELESAYRNDPTVDIVIRELVTRYEQAGRLDEADRVLTAVLNRDPENVEWLRRSGEIAIAQNDRSKALANLKMAAKLSGYQPQMTNKVFEACETFNIPEQGIEFFESAIPPGRREPEVMLGYAKLKARMGDANGAIETARLALHRKGYGSFDFLRDLTVAIRVMFGGQALGRFQEPPREAVFERSNQHILSMLHHSQGEYAQADEINRRLVESTSDVDEQAMLWFRIGFCQEAENRFAEARASYEKALELDEDHPAALNNLAYLLTEHLDEPAEGVRRAEQAVAVATAATYVETLDTLGTALLANGDVRAAIGKLSRARDTDSNYVPATFHLAEAYRCAGEFETAAELYREVIATPAGGAFEKYKAQAAEGLAKAEQKLADCP